MAVLDKIRSRGILLLIVVGAALIIFIVGDFVNSGSTLFQENKANVAKINGEKVKVMDYQRTIEQFNNVVEMEYGANIDSEMAEQIRQMVWDNTIRESIINTECAKMGMMVTENELTDIIIGSHPSPMLSSLRMFLDENGQFDVNALKQFISALDSEEIAAQMPYDELEKYRNYWRYWEKSIKLERLDNKYRTLLAKSMVANPLEAKYAFNNAKNNSTVVYAMKNYMAVPDSTVAVSDSEIKARYNQKKEQFKQENSADIQYIAVQLRPSKEDYNEAEEWIEELKAEFATTTDIAGVVNDNSDEAYRSENLTAEQVDADFREFAFSGNMDSVMGPIFVNDTYKMARIVESGILSPDSVKLSHIYLRRETAEATQALADSIEGALKQGANFALLAAQHSIAQNAKNGGEIGWISEQGLDTKIATPAFSTPVNGTFQVKEGNDINLFIVTEAKEKVQKVKLAVIARKVDASSQTRTELYGALKQFIVDNNDIELFTANASEAGYVVEKANKVNINASTLNNVKNAREAIRWAFENKEGAVSDIFEIDNAIIAVTPAKIYEKGYRSIDEVRDILTAEIRKEKKGDILLEQVGSKGMAQLIADGFISDTLRNVNFASNYVGSIGNEPSLFANVDKVEVGKESAALKGNAGIFMFNVIDRQENPREYNEKEEMVMLSTRENYMIQYLYVEALKEAANIQDFRYRYY